MVGAVQASTTPPDAKKRNPSVAWAQETIAILLWIYGISTIAFPNFDDALVQYLAPKLAFTIDYKPLFVGLLVVLPIVFWKHAQIRWFVLFVLLYPLILLFWRLPKLIIKKWAVVLAFAPAFYDVVITFRVTAIIYSLMMASAFLIVIAPPALAAIAGSLLLATLFVYMWIGIKHSFQVTAFGQLTKIVKQFHYAVDCGKWDKPFEPAAQPQQTEITAPGAAIPLTAGTLTAEPVAPTGSSPLLIVYAVNQILQGAADRVSQMAGSRLLDVYLIGGVIFRIFLVLVVFSFVYLALWRYDASTFNCGPDTVWYEFIGYGIDTQFNAGVSSLKAASPGAVILTYMHVVLFWICGLFFTFMLLTTQREKYEEDLVLFIAELRAAAGAVAERCLARVDQSIEQIEVNLVADHEKLVTALRRLRGLDPLSHDEGSGAKTSSAPKERTDVLPLQLDNSNPTNSVEAAAPQSTRIDRKKRKKKRRKGND
eukprot:TRINITY_DN138_c2_g1_i2.p1 TRINITY_DN138_c2_g1~~TRINITY_DN138_c2_g1_i2.p1  ORF type:complete len:482 (-),score=46.60 TRINITY_DN138_c2_g1_i2:2965-4410(-)